MSDGTGSYRDILKNKEQAVALEQESRQVKSDDVAQQMIDDLEAKVAADPKNIKMLRSLGRALHAKEGIRLRALDAYKSDCMAVEGVN